MPQESTKESNPPLSNDVVFNVAGITEKPEFPGGMEKFYKFVGNNFQAPTEPNLKGKVYVMFIIEKDGSITNVSVLRDIGHGTGEEATRVIKLSPKWIPAQKDGVPVRVQYSLPITIMSSNL